MTELTTTLVTTPIKQAMAKKIKANLVFIGIFIVYKLSKIKGKVNKKIFLL
jgi:3-methyladenine DNA glycosylase Tag